jgi:CAAX prenyl protease-like protein
MIEREIELCATKPTRALLSRTLPFALFMAFIGVGELAQFLAQQGMLALEPETLYYLYPVKTVAVGSLLYAYRGEYRELSWKELANRKSSVAAVVIGLLTCVMWVLTDWTIAVTGPPKGFNPALLPAGAVRFLMTATRVAGAVLVVPLMEELFWRSFLLRYLVDSDFESVPLGRFTWISFIATTLLFGLEHNLILAGMIAGAIYSAILYKTRSLSQCVLAHAVTNLALAGYVLYAGRWDFW